MIGEVLKGSLMKLSTPAKAPGEVFLMSIKVHGLVIREIQPICKVMFVSACGAAFTRFFRLTTRLVILVLALSCPAWAEGENPSGLELPRFVTTRSNPINVRVGPGIKYEIAWVYIKDAVPVEIVQEFDTWRKIRGVDGQEGWVHQSLLQGPRAGYVTPLVAKTNAALHAGPSDNSAIRATLGAGLRVAIKECDGHWCEVSVSQHGDGERIVSYSGYLRQAELWGVYPNEVFD